jgi:hypothetical protein
LEGNIATDFDLLNLADKANDGWLWSPLYEIMWRGWMTGGKGIITNRRYFFNAGWFWTTLDVYMKIAKQLMNR